MMKKMIIFVMATLLLLVACSPAQLPTLPPTESPLPPTDTPTDIPTLPSVTEELIITFEPNPVTAYQSDQGNWVWAFTFDVYNPNDFPVEVVAFGEFLQCHTDINECSYSSEDFEEWFTSCEPGGNPIPAKGHACDANWWIEFDMPLPNAFSGQYAVYYRDQENAIQVALSETLTIQMP